jgi:hypothetical protein
MDFERNNEGVVERAKPEFTGEDVARNLARLGYYDSVAMSRVANKVGENTRKHLGRQRLYQILKSRAPKREVIEWIARGLKVDTEELTRGNESHSGRPIGKLPDDILDDISPVVGRVDFNVFRNDVVSFIEYLRPLLRADWSRVTEGWESREIEVIREGFRLATLLARACYDQMTDTFGTTEDNDHD